MRELDSEFLRLAKKAVKWDNKPTHEKEGASEFVEGTINGETWIIELTQPRKDVHGRYFSHITQKMFVGEKYFNESGDDILVELGKGRRPIDERRNWKKLKDQGVVQKNLEELQEAVDFLNSLNNA